VVRIKSPSRGRPGLFIFENRLAAASWILGGDEGDADDLDAFARGAALRAAGWDGGDGFEDIVARNELAVGGVLFVEELGVTVAKEKLRARAVRASRAGGGEDAAHVILGVELSLDLVAGATGAGLAAGALFGVGAAALDHEAFDDAVKRSAIVKAVFGEFLKVFYVAWRDVRPEFEGDVALGGGDNGQFFGGGAHGWERAQLTQSQRAGKPALDFRV